MPAIVPDSYSMETRPPSASEYFRLRSETGLTPKTLPQCEATVESPANWAFRTVRHSESGEVVGMGRVVSDGAWYFLIADIAVLPEHRGQGLGRAVTEALVSELRDRAGEGAYVTLTADAPGRPLYESIGFTHVSDRGASGMEMRL